MTGLVVLGLVLLAIGCILGAGAIRREQQREDARMFEVVWREARLMNDQFDMNKALRESGTHLLKRVGYKPAAAYLAPAKPEPVRPANVSTLRRKAK